MTRQLKKKTKKQHNYINTSSNELTEMTEDCIIIHTRYVFTCTVQYNTFSDWSSSTVLYYRTVDIDSSHGLQVYYYTVNCSLLVQYCTVCSVHCTVVHAVAYVLTGVCVQYSICSTVVRNPNCT